MNILFLSHRIPYPPNKGDKIRSFHELAFLSREHNVFLATLLDSDSDVTYLPHLRGHYCKEVYAVRSKRYSALINGLLSGQSFSVSHFYNRHLQQFVDDTLESKQIDAILCYCSSMAEYIFNTPYFKEHRLGNVKLLMDFVDLDSDKWHQYTRYSKYPSKYLYELESKRLARYEIKINQTFQHSIFVSDREVAALKRLLPEPKSVHVIPNGVDTDYFRPYDYSLDHWQQQDFRPILLFTGYMDYFANEDAVTWFCESILPLVKLQFRDVQLYIVGNRPTKRVRNLACTDGVHVTGYVDDIRHYYWMADVCVMPLRIARGLQNKVLEAMATGNSIVSTSNASDGIICQDNEDIVIADDAKLFAAQVVDLLGNESRRKILGLNARANICKNYRWNTNLHALDQLLSC
jgi:polysaccharide biosynthesis protein PslH